MTINVQAYTQTMLAALDTELSSNPQMQDAFTILLNEPQWLAVPQTERIAAYQELIARILEKDNREQQLGFLQSIAASCSDWEPNQVVHLFYSSDYSFELREMLNWAARNGHEKIVEALLMLTPLNAQQLSEFLNKIDERVGPEDTAFIEAARNGHEEVMKVMINLFFAADNPQEENEGEEEGDELAPEDNLVAQKHLMDSLNRPNAQGQTAVTEAARNNCQAIFNIIDNAVSHPVFFAQLLLHSDADNKTALMYEEDNRPALKFENEARLERQNEAYMQARLMEENGEMKTPLVEQEEEALFTLDLIMDATCELIHYFIAIKNHKAAIGLIESLTPQMKYRCAKKAMSSYDNFTMLRAAVEHAPVKMVAVILKDLHWEEKIDLLSGKTNAALAAAERLQDVDMMGYLRVQITGLLTTKDANGNTPLLAAIEKRDIHRIKNIFGALFSGDEWFKIENRVSLLLQQDSQGRGPFEKALADDQDIVSYLHNMVQSCLVFLVQVEMNTESATDYKLSLIIQVLKSLPIDVKFSILIARYTDLASYSIPMLAVSFNYWKLLPHMFEGFDRQEVDAIVSTSRNALGTNVLDIANVVHSPEMIAFFNDMAPHAVNPPHSTHTRIVHDTIARSAVHLMVSYMSLPEEDAAILQSWAASNSAQPDDSLKKEAMQRVVMKPTTQRAFSKLRECFVPAVHQWAEAAACASNKEAAALRGVVKIMTHPEFVPYKEGQTHIGLNELLALVWMAIHDKVEHARNAALQNIDFETRCANGREALMLALFEAIRDKNLVNGQDLHPRTQEDPETEDRSKCQDGFFNNLISVLISIKPETTVNYVNRRTVKLKTFSLVPELFNTADYSVEQLTELNSSLEETYLLSDAIKAQLASKVIAALHLEFDEFIDRGVLQPSDIEDALDAALNLRGEDSHRVVERMTAKIAKDVRMQQPEPVESSVVCESSVVPPQTVVSQAPPQMADLLPGMQGLTIHLSPESQTQTHSNDHSAHDVHDAANNMKRQRSPSPGGARKR